MARSGLRPSDRQLCDALRAERMVLIAQLARHKPRSHRHAVLAIRLLDATARLLEVENRIAAEPEIKWKDDESEYFPDQKSRAAGH